MRRLHVFYHMMKADFLERARRTSFLFTMILSAYLSYTVYRGQMTLTLGRYRGEFNSAWIGASLVAVSVTMLMLVGFYVVKNALERDRKTRVGEILASTRMTRLEYCAGKALSNFAVLVAMLSVSAVCALLMQFFKLEEGGVDLWGLFSPFLFLALPVLALVAAIAVLFEVVPFLRGSFGNTAYFGLWIGTMMTTFLGHIDVFGIGALWRSMGAACRAKYPQYDNSFSLGGGFQHNDRMLFHWNGMDWTPELLLARLQWVGVAAGFVLLAAFFFDRFDRAGSVAKEGSEAQAPETEAVAAAPAAPHPSQWTPARRSFRFLDLLLAELRLMLKGMPWWWFTVAGGLVFAALLIKPDVGPRSVGFVSWLWLLPIWSSMGSRESHHGTRQLVFSAPHPLARQLPITWLAGFLLTLAAGGGVAVKLAIAGHWAHLGGWIVGAAFIPSLALALGTWSGSPRLFELVYLLWWYIGPLNQVHPMDYMAAWPETLAAGIPLYYAAFTLLLLLASVPARRRQVYV